MSEAKNRQDEIDTVAANWAARLGGDPLSGSERYALDGWLAQSPAHAAAFEEARVAWDRMGQLRFAAEKPAAMAEPATPPPVIAVSSFTRRRRHRPLWIKAAALAACLLLLVGAAGLWFGDPRVLLAGDYRTAPGEQLSVDLSDGSRVDLGPASAIAVDYGKNERRIELLTGLALFTAAPRDERERRPFVVAAANGTARALGTRFMVAHRDEHVEVTVIEHQVEVALTRPVPPTRTVLPGRAIVFSATGSMGKARRVNTDHATAWRRNRLIFDHKPLSQVVTELNRYRHGRFLIVDRDLSSRQVSGVFDLSDPEAALAAIVRNLRIETTSLPPLVTLLH